MTLDIAPDPQAPVPQHLYKYRSLRGEDKNYARDLILHQRLYFASPAQLNDPFEFQPVLDFAVTLEQRRAYLKELVLRLHGDKPRPERRRIEKALDANPEAMRQSMRTSYRQTMDKVGVFSMSAEPFDLLMWPHYADNHAGVCVRFDLWTLVEVQHAPYFVTYSNKRPITNPMIDGPKEMLHKAALVKGLPWSYEQEWRLLLNRQGGHIVKFQLPIISGVILGARISPQDKKDVLEWVAACGRPMEVFQARFHENAYELVVAGENVDQS